MNISHGTEHLSANVVVNDQGHVPDFDNLHTIFCFTVSPACFLIQENTCMVFDYIGREIC